MNDVEKALDSVSGLDKKHTIKTKKIRNNPFSRWLNSPSKGFIFFYSITFIFMTAGNVAVFACMSVFALLYGRRVRTRSEDDNIHNIALHMSSLGRLGIWFISIAILLTLTQLSILHSTQVPHYIAENTTYLLAFSIFSLFSTVVGNLVLLVRNRPPVRTLFSIYPRILGYIWYKTTTAVGLAIEEFYQGATRPPRASKPEKKVE